jgi:hypothetical protein
LAIVRELGKLVEKAQNHCKRLVIQQVIWSEPARLADRKEKKPIIISLTHGWGATCERHFFDGR